MATPALNQLLGFPTVLTLTARRSETFNSGASVTSPEAGTLMMRFELPAGWVFDNGSSTQQTSMSVAAGQTVSLLMNWRATAPTDHELVVRLTVFVSLQGNPGERQQSAVMSVQNAGVSAVAEAVSTPVLNALQGFPPEVTLFPANSVLRSAVFTSGANVTSASAGIVVMRFEAPPGYTFDNNSPQQSTARTFSAGETASMSMSWRVTTANTTDLVLRISVGVSLQNQSGEKFDSAVMPIARASLMQRFLNRLRQMMHR